MKIKSINPLLCIIISVVTIIFCFTAMIQYAYSRFHKNPTGIDTRIASVRETYKNIKEYSTLDYYTNKKDKTTTIGLNSFGIDGSAFCFRFRVSKTVTSLLQVNPKDIKDLYESYEVSNPNLKATSKNKSKYYMYSSYQTKSGKGNYTTSSPSTKKTIDVCKIQSLADNKSVLGVFDLAYCMKGLDFKEKKLNDTQIQYTATDKGINPKVTLIIIVNKTTMLPVSEEYDSKDMNLKRFYYEIGKALPNGDSFFHMSIDKKLEFIKIYCK